MKDSVLNAVPVFTTTFVIVKDEHYCIYLTVFYDEMQVSGLCSSV